MSTCTLGQGPFPLMKHPGPVIAYAWHGTVMPAWAPEAFAAQAEREDVHPLHRAFARSIVHEATPIYPYREERVETQVWREGRWQLATGLEPGTEYHIRARGIRGV